MATDQKTSHFHTFAARNRLPRDSLADNISVQNCNRDSRALCAVILEHVSLRCNEVKKPVSWTIDPTVRLVDASSTFTRSIQQTRDVKTATPLCGGAIERFLRRECVSARAYVGGTNWNRLH